MLTWVKPAVIVPAMGKIENVVKVSIADGEKRPVADIVLRKGTADERSVHSVIGKREYNILISGGAMNYAQCTVRSWPPAKRH